MYYICKKRDDGTFGIMDTTDGVVEYYNPREIGKMIKQFHLEIEGARIENNKVKLTVKKPTKFEDKGTYDENGTEIPTLKETLRGTETSRLLDMSAQIVNKAESSSPIVRSGFASSFDGLYEGTLRSEFIDKLQNSAGFIIRALNKVIGGISGVVFDDILDLDGWDCVGFENIHVKNHPEFTVSIYTNPEVSVTESGNGHWELKSVDSRGFGIDLYKGREIISHIDGSWKTWEKDIEESDEYKLIHSKKIVPLDEMPITEYDNLVYPLYKLICDVANKISLKNYNVSEVQYLDGYDCVGIDFSDISPKGKVSISVFSNGLIGYNESGEIGKNIGVDYSFNDAVSTLFRTGELDKKLNKSDMKYITIDDNHVHIEVPESEYRDGLSAAVAMRTALNIGQTVAVKSLPSDVIQ